MRLRVLCGYALPLLTQTMTVESHASLTELDGQLSQGEVHVWLAKLDLDDVTIARLTSFLNSEEQDRASRFKVDSARTQFIASRTFLRIALGKYLSLEPQQLEFRSGPQGKPELPAHRDLHFNLSHTEGLAAIAVTKVGAVGIDVERVRENVEALQLASRYFSKKEVEWLRAQTDRAASFFSCWTAKEAYIKAHGGGLSIPLDSFAVIPDPARPELPLEILAAPAESKNWTLRRLDLPAEFRGAVAIHAQSCQIRLGWLSA